MASGDLTGEFDERRGLHMFPVAGFKLEIIVANGASTKEEDINKNMMLTDLYFNVPAIVTGVANKAKLELLDVDDHVVYSTGDLAATAATKYPIHLQRAIMDATTFKVTTDGNVNADETFYVTARGM